MFEHVPMLALVAGGSLTNALVQLKNSRDRRESFDAVDFLIAMGISTFAGTMFAIGAHYFSEDVLVQHGVSGAGAFMGLNGLNRVTDTLLEIILHRANQTTGDAK